MNNISYSQITITVSCFLLLIVIGCGKEEELQKEKKELKADVTVKMPKADTEKEAQITFAAEINEQVKVGENVGVDGIINFPSLAGQSQEVVKTTTLTIYISHRLPNGIMSVAKSGTASLSSLGNNEYQYHGILKSPRRAGKYEVEIIHLGKKVASKKLVVTE